jgi:hypothetical protein
MATCYYMVKSFEEPEIAADAASEVETIKLPNSHVTFVRFATPKQWEDAKKILDCRGTLYPIRLPGWREYDGELSACIRKVLGRLVAEDLLEVKNENLTKFDTQTAKAGKKTVGK